MRRLIYSIGRPQSKSRQKKSRQTRPRIGRPSNRRPTIEVSIMEDLIEAEDVCTGSEDLSLEDPVTV